MTDTTENASSTNLDDLAEAMHLLELAYVAARQALHTAQDAHHAPAETDEQTAKVYAQLEVAGRSRQRAAAKAEEACRLLARLAALRD